jgi:ABC-2 type transport system permease protein
MSFIIVAGKEFRDHIQNKRFLIIFGILLLVVFLSLNDGLNEYNQRLDTYKAVVSRVQSAPQGNTPMPQKPSPLMIFYSMISYFTPIGAVLAISMGFDLISKEKEEGSLKSLLSHPLFRDNVIIGKLLGALGVFTIVTFIVTLICTGFLMMSGISPSGNETLRIAAYMFFSLLFLISFFSIALACSVIAPSSGLSVTYCIGIVIIISFMLPAIGTAVATKVAGTQPSFADYGVIPGSQGSQGLNNMTDAERQQMQERMNEYRNASQNYFQKVNSIERIFNIPAPDKSYNTISRRVLTGSASGRFFGGDFFRVGTNPSKPETLADSLGAVFSEIIALLILSVIALLVAYLRFMRLDIR